MSTALTSTGARAHVSDALEAGDTAGWRLGVSMAREYSALALDFEIRAEAAERAHAARAA